MLHLYIYGTGGRPEDIIPYGMELVNDVEAEFRSVGISVTDTSKKLVADIDGGELLDRSRFMSSVGVSTFTGFLSTGTKAGVLVEKSAETHKVINLIECGINAITAIIIHCHDGYATLFDPLRALELDRDLPLDTPIDVITEDGARLRTVQEFNEYIQFDRGTGKYSEAREQWKNKQFMLRQQNEKK